MKKLKKLLYLLDIHKEKKKIAFILIMAIFMTVIETIGISLIMPFIQMALDFNVIHNNEYYNSVYTFLSFSSEQKFVIVSGIFLIAFFFFRAAYTLFYNYNISKYTKIVYQNVSNKLFSGFIGLSYREFIERNSSRLTQMIVTEANSVSMLLRSLIISFGDVLTIVVIYFFLLFMNWKITLAFTLFLAFNIFVLSRTVTKKIKQSGSERAEMNRMLFKTLQESFGNFKMIKLRTDEENVEYRFKGILRKLVHIAITNETLQQIPRLFLELIGFLLIICIIIYWIATDKSNIAVHMGVLSVFLFAMYRLLPAFNRVFSGYNQIAFLKRSLELIQENLLYKTEALGNDTISFTEVIELKSVMFAYNTERLVLKEVNLHIQKNDRIAFIGPSGSGKSTLADIICGLYKPSSGEILVDKTVLNESNVRAWRRKIGYIPQDIYLLDSTVAQNVALLPEEEIDRDRVTTVLKQAHIFEFLQTHQQGIDTIVGEKGVKLSGGQKQRIAIARALYHNPEILVLDEATSALDTETEKEIMKNIYEVGRDKTLLIITHRLTTIEECETVYTIENGEVRRVRS